MFDITVTIVFHSEGAYALPALTSMEQLISKARATGLRVESQAVLDNVDALTRQVVSVRGAWLDNIDEVCLVT